jgi:hypothetical protein
VRRVGGARTTLLGAARAAAWLGIVAAACAAAGAALRGGLDGVAGRTGATRARENERERTERKTADSFKNTIFGGRVRGPPKITLFSATVSAGCRK